MFGKLGEQGVERGGDVKNTSVCDVDFQFLVMYVKIEYVVDPEADGVRGRAQHDGLVLMAVVGAQKRFL